MEFSFDLISDLHIETWNQFNWTGQATSPYCVVAGDISQDRRILEETLRHLSKCYQGVFFIDGNDEHRNYLNDINGSYNDLRQFVDKFKNVVFLKDNVVVLNGVAFLAANGWWTYDLDPTIDTHLSQEWFCQRYDVNSAVPDTILSKAVSDASYLRHSIRKLQMHQDVRAIVVITHTVPGAWLIDHDLELSGHYRFNTTGNPLVASALEQDSENKVKAWCFGHYHRPVDRELNGIRYVNNCRGRGNTPWSQAAYYPKRITVSF